MSVGLDAEWVLESAGKNDPELSVQRAQRRQRSEAGDNHISEKGKRITLENGLTRVMLKAMKKGVIAKVPNRFIITAHFTRADLTTFAGFWTVQAQHRRGAQIVCDDRATVTAELARTKVRSGVARPWSIPCC